MANRLGQINDPVDNINFEKTNELKYLDAIINSKNEKTEELKKKIHAEKACFFFWDYETFKKFKTPNLQNYILPVTM